MRRFGSKATVLAAVAFTAALAGCGGSSGASASPAAASATPAAAAASASPAAAASASPAPASAPVIGISVKTITNDPFQTAWVNAATSKIEALGGKVRLLVAGGETAVATQASQCTGTPSANSITAPARQNSLRGLLAGPPLRSASCSTWPDSRRRRPSGPSRGCWRRRTRTGTSPSRPTRSPLRTYRAAVGIGSWSSRARPWPRG